jgi:anti-sigma factor RsiW
MSEITRDMLMAYADGQLDPATRQAVDEHLARDSEAAAEVAVMQRQADAIRALYAPAGAEAIPGRLDPRSVAADLSRRRARRFVAATAAAVLLGLGLAGGWFLRPVLEQRPASAVLIADAINAHSVYVAENRHAVEVDGADSDHLSTWLSNRLQTNLGMPNLEAEGFTLVGGRLLPGEPELGGRAAQLMYEDAGKQRVTIYVTAALPDKEPTYQFSRYEGKDAFYWANAHITCTVVGTLSEERMQAVSQTIYAQLSAGEAEEESYRGT